MMVDAGGNVLMFCKTFVSWFKPNGAVLAKRTRDLEFTFKSLLLTHTHGRDERVLEGIRVELAALTEAKT